ncbi:HalOD1 output domain-containing protein [Natrialbaceae archaeon GCM10025810]|uniref:HalOD1 output domain-containing protein n=1 Tax=Halovalidus salilacus TaxID=3075124 RepID=UPI00361AD6DC
MEQGELTIYRRCTPVVDAKYGPENNRSPTEVIIYALAEAAGVDPLELPPLYEYVDGDAVDSLFDEHDGANDTNALLSFRVQNWNVFVRADGRVRVCDGTRPTNPEPVFESTPV